MLSRIRNRPLSLSLVSAVTRMKNASARNRQDGNAVRSRATLRCCRSHISVLPRIHKEGDDGFFAKRLGGLQPVQTLNKYEARAVRPDQDRRLQALVENAGRDLVYSFSASLNIRCFRARSPLNRRYRLSPIMVTASRARSCSEKCDGGGAQGPRTGKRAGKPMTIPRRGWTCSPNRPGALQCAASETPAGECGRGPQWLPDPHGWD